MSQTQTPKRARSPRVETVGAESRVPSEKVDNFFRAAGSKVSSAPPKRPPPLPPSKPAAPNQQKEHYGSRIKVATAEIEADMAVLALVPGLETWTGQIRARLKQATSLQADNKWQDSYRSLEAMQTELHDQVMSQRKAMRDSMATTGKQQSSLEEQRVKLAQHADALRGMPGAAAAAAAADWSLAEADKRNRAGDLPGALEYLSKGGSKAKQAVQEWTDARKAAESAFGPLMTTMQALKAEVDQASKSLPAKTATELQQAHKTLQDRIVAGVPDGKAERATAQQAFMGQANDLKNRIDTLLTPAKRQRQTAETWLSALEGAIEGAGDAQPASETAAAYKALLAIRADMADREFASAATAAEALGKTVRTWTVLPEDKQARFKAVAAAFRPGAEAELARAQSMLAAVKQAPVLETPPSAASVVDSLAVQLKIFGEMGGDFVLSNGLEAVKQAKAANDRNDARLKDYRALQKTRTERTATIAILMADASSALDTLKQKIAKAGAPVRVPSLEDALTAAESDWTAASRTALTEKDLPFDEIKARLLDLKKQIDATAADPVKLVGKKTEAAYAGLADMFAAARAVADKAIEALLQSDFATGDTQRSAAKAAGERFRAAVKARDEAAAQAAVADLAAIGSAAGKSAQAAEGKAAQMRLAFDTARDDIRKALERLSTDAADKKCRDYAGLVTTLQASFDEIAATGASGDASVLGEGVDLFYALRGDANGLRSLFDTLLKGGKPGPNDLTVDSLSKKADKFADSFKDKIVSSLEAPALQALLDKLAAVTAQIGTVRLGESAAALTALETEWAALKTKAAQRDKDRVSFTERVAAAAAPLGKGNVLPGCIAYEKALKARLDSLSAAAKTGDVDEKALAALLAELEEAKLHPEAASRGVDRVETDALQAEIAAKRWQADYTAFGGKKKALHAVLATLEGVAKTNFQAQLDALETAAENIDKKKKSTPYETMAEQLQTLVANADTMLKYPMGQATHARGELLAVDGRWNRAVAEFHSQMDALVKTITAAGQADAAAGVAAVAEKATAVKRLTTPGMITPMIQKVIDAKNDITAARDAREAALREVKRMQHLVAGHPYLVQFASNPFGVDVTGPIANLAAALFDLETNLLISL